MPKDLFLDLSSRHRRRETNVVLGGLLAFVAGAINAGGFLAVHRYTSHMTGVVSAIADDLFLGETVLAMAGVSSLLAFMAGAATTAALINWARRRDMHGGNCLFFGRGQGWFGTIASGGWKMGVVAATFVF